MSRGATAFEIFCERSPPVGTVAGVVYVSGLKTSESGIFVTAELSVPVSVKSALGQIACPDSGSGLNLGDLPELIDVLQTVGYS